MTARVAFAILNPGWARRRAPPRLRLLAVFAAAAMAAFSQNASRSTGLDVGEPIPSIEAPDQDGRIRAFADMAGPNGLLLLFHRSADW